jgi:putative phosphoribosyl transferase
VPTERGRIAAPKGGERGSHTFSDRREAGRALAIAVSQYADRAPIVVGLARGGVPVAFEVARALEAPLDVLVVRKLGVPAQPELGMGAIAEGGARVLNSDVLRHARVSENELAMVEHRERAELERRAGLYRDGAPALELRGRTVLVVDDGLATGGTMRAAAEGVRSRGATAVVVAVPVGARQTVDAIATDVDDVVSVATPINLRAVGEWYGDFSPTTDDEVLALLRRARSPRL